MEREVLPSRKENVLSSRVSKLLQHVCVQEQNKYAFSKVASLSEDIAEMNLRPVRQCVPVKQAGWPDDGIIGKTATAILVDMIHILNHLPRPWRDQPQLKLTASRNLLVVFPTFVGLWWSTPSATTTTTSTRRAATTTNSPTKTHHQQFLWGSLQSLLPRSQDSRLGCPGILPWSLAISWSTNHLQGSSLSSKKTSLKPPINHLFRTWPPVCTSDFDRLSGHRMSVRPSW